MTQLPDWQEVASTRDALSLLTETGNVDLAIRFPFSVSGPYARMDAIALSNRIESDAARAGLVYAIDARMINPFNLAIWISLAGAASAMQPILQYLDDLTRLE